MLNMPCPAATPPSVKEYTVLEKSYDIEDWINRAPEREVETTEEVDKSLIEILEYEEELKKSELDEWKANGWQERSDYEMRSPHSELVVKCTTPT